MTESAARGIIAQPPACTSFHKFTVVSSFDVLAGALAELAGIRMTSSVPGVPGRVGLAAEGVLSERVFCANKPRDSSPSGAAIAWPKNEVAPKSRATQQ